MIRQWHPGSLLSAEQLPKFLDLFGAAGRRESTGDVQVFGEATARGIKAGGPESL